MPDTRIPPHVRQRLMEVDSGCWEWTGRLDTFGYGQVDWPNSKKAQSAHRAIYKHLIGEIPEGMELDHLCRNRRCANPAHLEPVTHRENCRRGLKGILRTHCKLGHELTPENTYVQPKTGQRHCRKCKRATLIAWAKANPERYREIQIAAGRRNDAKRRGKRRGKPA